MKQKNDENSDPAQEERIRRLREEGERLRRIYEEEERRLRYLVIFVIFGHFQSFLATFGMVTFGTSMNCFTIPIN